MKVCIGLVLSHGFPVPAAFVKSYSLLQQWLLQGLGNAQLPPERRIDAARVLFLEDFPIDHARNKAVRLFLDHDDADYLLFLDTDMTHPPDLPHRLVRHGLDIVTGRYVMRKPPYHTVAMRKTGPGPTDYNAINKLEANVTGLLPIDGGGAGALLMSRTALQAMRAVLGDDWFRYEDGPDGVRSRSEDMWFYRQALACGFQPWLDADAVCGHVESRIVDPANHEPYAEAYRRQQAAEVSAGTELAYQDGSAVK